MDLRDFTIFNTNYSQAPFNMGLHPRQTVRHEVLFVGRGVSVLAGGEDLI